MNNDIVSTGNDFFVVRSIEDLLEQTAQDLYDLGDLTPDGLDEVLDIIKNDPAMENIRNVTTPDIEKRWGEAISDLHNRKIEPVEYAERINDLMDEMEEAYRDDMLDSYDRAMGII